MKSTSDQQDSTERTARSPEPEDARRGMVAFNPADRLEAAADREMADAERAVVIGSATDEQTTRVAAVGAGRTQKDRRRLWMDGS